MNTFKLSFVILNLSCVANTTQAQTFQDLNFEEASIPASTQVGTLVPTSEAFPGWSAYFTTSGASTAPLTQVAYDGISTGGAVISIIDSKGATPIQGNYSAYLFGGGSIPLSSSSISQTGTIPAGTESLFMDAHVFGASPIVSINGQQIEMFALQTVANYTVYGGTVPASDVGQSVTLSFTEPPNPPGTGQPSEFEFDNISFSTESTPEPSIVVLTGVSGVLFLVRRKIVHSR